MSNLDTINDIESSLILCYTLALLSILVLLLTIAIIWQPIKLSLLKVLICQLISDVLLGSIMEPSMDFISIVITISFGFEWRIWWTPIWIWFIVLGLESFICSFMFNDWISMINGDILILSWW